MTIKLFLNDFCIVFLCVVNCAYLGSSWWATTSECFDSKRRLEENSREVRFVNWRYSENIGNCSPEVKRPEAEAAKTSFRQ